MFLAPSVSDACLLLWWTCQAFDIELFSVDRRYGLIGPNGCGKSSLLKALGNREVPIPDHIDIYYLDREVEASDQTALQAVMSVDSLKTKLEAEAEKLLDKDDAESQALLEDIYERYDVPPLSLLAAVLLHWKLYNIISVGCWPHTCHTLQRCLLKIAFMLGPS